MMQHNGWGWGSGSWPWACGLILILAAAIGIAIWLSSRHVPVETRSAAQILDERFARGELTEADYRRSRDFLDDRR